MKCDVMPSMQPPIFVNIQSCGNMATVSMYALAAQRLSKKSLRLNVMCRKYANSAQGGSRGKIIIVSCSFWYVAL